MSNYYVATTGSNSNPGTLASPFLTLQHASDVSAPGDIINVRAGSYAGFTVTNSGTSGNIIIYQNYNGEAFRIDASLGTVSGAIFSAVAVSVRNKAYITFSGITVTGDDAFAEFELFGSHHVQILSCDVSFALSTGIGIYDSCDNIYIYDNTIHDNSQSNFPRGQPGDWGAGLISAYGNSNITFYKNYIYWNHGEGCTMGAHTHDSIMDGNIISDNWSMNAYIESSQNITVRNNIIYNTDQARAGTSCVSSCGHSNPVGIGLSSGDNSGGFSGANVWLTGLKIYNNIITHCDWQIQRFSTGSNTPDSDWLIACNTIILNGDPGIKLGSGASSLSNISIQDNIFTGTLGTSFSDWAWLNFTRVPTGQVINHNTYAGPVANWIITSTTYTSFSGWTSASGETSSSTATANLINPTFTLPQLWGSSPANPTTVLSLATTNFRLQLPSSAIAAGLNLATVPTDILAITRVNPTAKGSFEFLTSGQFITTTPVVRTWVVNSVSLPKVITTTPVIRNWVVNNPIITGGFPLNITPTSVVRNWIVNDPALAVPLSGITPVIRNWVVNSPSVSLGPVTATPYIITLCNNTFNPTAPTFQTYSAVDATGVQDYVYADPPLAFPNNIYPYIQRISDNAVICCGNSSVNFQGLIIFDSQLNFVSSQVLTAPFATTGSADNCPWLYRTNGGTIYGLWFGTTDSQLITLHPVTFAQTVLWNNFNSGGSFCNGVEISGDGTLFFYLEIPGAATLFALDTALGTTSTFATLTGYRLVPGTKPASNSPTNRLYVPWVKNSDNSIRVIVYNINGSVFLDKNLSGTFQDYAFCAEDLDGSGFWVFGSTAPGAWALNRYLLPSGTFDLGAAATVDPDTIIFQMSIVQIGAPPVSADISGTATFTIRRPDIFATAIVPKYGTGIYIVKPGKTNDSVYTNISPPAFDSVKIPNPFIDTYLVGDE